MVEATWARAWASLAIAFITQVCVTESAGAVDVVGTEAPFVWGASEGPVSSYLVFASRNGGAQTSYDLRAPGDRQTVVRGDIGDSFQVWIQAVASDGNASPLSPASEVVHFVEAAPDPPGGDPSGGSPPDPDPSPPPDPPDPEPPPDEPDGGSDPGPAEGPSPIDPVSIPGAPFDFDGDGLAELLVRLADGTLEIWNPAHTRPEVDALRLGQLAWDESVVGAADYDADGFADLAIARHGDREVEIRLLGRRDAPELRRLSLDDRGAIVGSGDVDGDGSADLVFETGRSLDAWLQLWGSPRSDRIGSLPDGIPLATPDADGDGDADVLHGERRLDLQLFENGREQGEISSIAPIDGPEALLATCDLDGDGRDGAITRSGDTLVRVDLTARSSRTLDGSAHLLGLPLFGSGDYDGDGDCDLAILDPWDGGVTLLLLEGAHVLAERPLATLPPGASAVRAAGEGI